MKLYSKLSEKITPRNRRKLLFGVLSAYCCMALVPPESFLLFLENFPNPGKVPVGGYYFPPPRRGAGGKIDPQGCIFCMGKWFFCGKIEVNELEKLCDQARSCTNMLICVDTSPHLCTRMSICMFTCVQRHFDT